MWTSCLVAGALTAKMIPHAQNCYSCHSDHEAVDTTFVKF